MTANQKVKAAGGAMQNNPDHSPWVPYEAMAAWRRRYFWLLVLVLLGVAAGAACSLVLR